MSKGSKSQTITQKTEIPDFLRPVVQEQASIALQGLRDLRNRILGPTAAPSPAGIPIPGLAGKGGLGVAGNMPQKFLPGFPGVPVPEFGGLPTQNPLVGVDLSTVLPGAPTGTVGQTSQIPVVRTEGTPIKPQIGVDSAGNPIEGTSFVADFSPDEKLAFDVARRRAAGAGEFFSLPKETLSAVARGQGIGPELTRVLARAATQGSIPDVARDALSSAARGDFLFGNPGFNAALDAARRRAQGDVLSVFGRAGSGAATGGLAQAAIAQASADAFANLFSQERARQLQAASNLSALSGQDRARQLQAAGIFCDLQNAERNRQLQATQLLPGLATADINLLQTIGSAQRGLAQENIDRPIALDERLVALSQGLVPTGSLLGSSQTQPLFRNRGAGILGGALAGASLLGKEGALSGLGAKLGGLAGPIGAIGGALLGGFF